MENGHLYRWFTVIFNNIALENWHFLIWFTNLAIIKVMFNNIAMENCHLYRWFTVIFNNIALENWHFFYRWYTNLAIIKVMFNNIAMGNCHFYRWFTYSKWWFSIAMFNVQILLETRLKPLRRRAGLGHPLDLPEINGTSGFSCG